MFYFLFLSSSFVVQLWNLMDKSRQVPTMKTMKKGRIEHIYPNGKKWLKFNLSSLATKLLAYIQAGSLTDSLQICQ